MTKINNVGGPLRGLRYKVEIIESATQSGGEDRVLSTTEMRDLISGAKARLTRAGVLWLVAQEQVPIGRTLTLTRALTLTLTLALALSLTRCPSDGCSPRMVTSRGWRRLSRRTAGSSPEA